MEKILFFGDSTTDCCRRRDDDASLGEGYAFLVKAQLGLENPEKYTFINRGISGHRIVDLYARIKSDLINLAPDYVSILIGINDVWHEILGHNGVNSERFELIYDLIIADIKAALPDTKIMIMEPFVLRGFNTENIEAVPNRWEYFKNEVPVKSQIARKIAQKYSLPFIELQSKFDEASKKHDASYWLYDGVHPTPMGHAIIAEEWIKAFNTLNENK